MIVKHSRGVILCDVVFFIRYQPCLRVHGRPTYAESGDASKPHLSTLNSKKIKMSIITTRAIINSITTTDMCFIYLLFRLRINDFDSICLFGSLSQSIFIMSRDEMYIIKLGASRVFVSSRLRFCRFSGS